MHRIEREARSRNRMPRDGTRPTLFKLKLQAASPTHQFRLTAALAASIGLVMSPERTEVGEDAGWVVLRDLSISSRPTHRSEPIINMTPFGLSNSNSKQAETPQLGTNPCFCRHFIRPLTVGWGELGVASQTQQAAGLHEGAYGYILMFNSSNPFLGSLDAAIYPPPPLAPHSHP